MSAAFARFSVLFVRFPRVPRSPNGPRDAALGGIRLERRPTLLGVGEPLLEVGDAPQPVADARAGVARAVEEDAGAGRLLGATAAATSVAGLP